MKLEYMKEYIAVVESLNFTAAANKLLMTQSSLSRHIAEVEECMGARLLYRDTRSVEVTPAGRLVYEEFAKILSIYDAIIVRAMLMNQHYKGALRVGVPYYCMHYMDDIIPLIKKNYPDIAVEILSFQPTPAYHALLNYQIDIAMLFRHEYPNSDDICFHDFAKEPLVLIINKDNPLYQKKFAEIKDLTGYVIVAFRNNNFSNFTQSLLCKHGVLPQKTVYSDHIDMMPYTIEESGGVAIEPVSVVNMNRPELFSIPLVGEDSAVNMTMAYRFDNKNPAISFFLEITDLTYPDFRV